MSYIIEIHRSTLQHELEKIQSKLVSSTHPVEKYYCYGIIDTLQWLLSNEPPPSERNRQG